MSETHSIRIANMNSCGRKETVRPQWASLL